VGLDELSDQLWIAVVESVRTWDRDGLNVGQYPQTGRIRGLDKRVTQTGDHQCRNDKMVKPFQGRVSSHRTELRRASKYAESTRAASIHEHPAGFGGGTGFSRDDQPSSLVRETNERH
jgi:hypothetical protein